MTRWVDDRLSRVRQYVTDESVFPLTINGHTITQLQSEVYEFDDRPTITVDIRLWCEQCAETVIVDTTIPAEDFETLRSLQLYSFAKFTTMSCE